MKALNFVLGMFVGVILLVVAVFGAAFAALSLVSVGQLESAAGTDIFDDASDVNDMTLLDIAMSLVDDLKDLDSLTIDKLRTDYGLKIPTEISGIDISPVFGYSLLEVPDHLGDIVNNMTLRDVGEFLSMDFENEYPDLKVLQDNLDEKVNDALDNVLSSIDDEKMTIYTIERDFGLSLGENNLVTTLKHTPLSSFAAVMDHLPVGTVIDADCDLFVPVTGNTLYVVADEYVEVPAGELTSPLADGKNVTETYIAGADEDGIVYREMRYVMLDDGSYAVDNDCYASSFDAAANTETYYRHIIYTAYDSSVRYGEDTVFAVNTYLNDFVSDGEGGFVLADGGFLTLDTVYADTDGTTLNARILSDPSLVKNGKIGFDGVDVFVSVTAEDGTVSLLPAAEYGLEEGVAPDDSTRLDDKFDGWLRLHVGGADPAMQVIAGETVSTISGATDAITSLKLGEVLDIDENSAKILKTLADTPINKMSEALDTITLADATDIKMSIYTEDRNGSYVKVSSKVGGTYYTLYNPSEPSHAGLTRYSKTETAGEASAALQRLAGVTIPNISAAFSDMVLGDALGVDVDTFAPVDENELTDGETYYVFNKPLGYPERVVYKKAEPAKPGVTYYKRTHEGEGNAVLKQLAYVKIDNVSEAMDGIIENTLLSDIIEVTEYTVAARSDTPSGSWLFEADSAYTETAGDKTSYYTFVYDGSGKYYMTDVAYLPATDEQKALFRNESNATVTFSYESNAGYTSAIDLIGARGGNIYFSDGDGGYELNPALLAYYVAQSVSADTDAADKALAALKATYSRVETADGDHTADIYTIAAGTAYGGLYVYNEGSVDGTNVTFGGYVLYDANDPTHWGAELYFKYSDGYYPASADATADNGYIRYSYSVDGGFYSDDNGAYIKLEGREETGRGTLYYYSLIDSEYKEGFTVYSKRECDYIFLENAESGGWVNVAGEWEEYDPDTHTDVEMRYDRVIGYIGNDAANDGGTEAGLAPLTDISVNVLDGKSPTILISLLERQVTIGSLNETIDTLTIGEMMEIEPGSLFDNELLSGATIETLSSRVNSMFSEMTIGTLLEYANVSVSAQLEYILRDIYITDFFGALVYKNGMIVVDMEKLFS